MDHVLHPEFVSVSLKVFLFSKMFREICMYVLYAGASEKFFLYELWLLLIKTKLLRKVRLNRCKGDIFGLCFFFMLHVYSNLICNWIINKMRWPKWVQTIEICSRQLVSNRITVQLNSSFTFDIAQCIYMYGYTYIYKSFYIVLSFIGVCLAIFFISLSVILKHMQFCNQK